MKYELKIPAISGDVIPLCHVADAMASAASTAFGTTPKHKPIYDYQLPLHTKSLLSEARAGRLLVCNQAGYQGTVDEIIAAAKSTGDLSEVFADFDAKEINWDMTYSLCIYTKLHCLNEWGKNRGDEFSIDNSVGWVDERGYMNPQAAPAAKGEADTSRSISVDGLMPTDTPAGKVEAVPVTSPSGDDVEEQAPDDHDEKLAALFDPLPVEALAKMFMIDLARWKKWQDKAKVNGLIDAREGSAKFNPYKAGVWLVRKGTQGWDDARLYRTLANNLPARSLDKAHLLTGGID